MLKIEIAVCRRLSSRASVVFQATQSIKVATGNHIVSPSARHTFRISTRGFVFCPPGRDPMSSGCALPDGAKAIQAASALAVIGV
ncbi:hypothetical protein [Burkholderia ubonensis]|uniref:hypothetical protein n=1 Tax=Burkholderia ubonensis TaxID=101571 RepID=UPI000B0D3751|nr:hypothetical protein [Burkholderia ubonensis]